MQERRKEALNAMIVKGVTVIVLPASEEPKRISFKIPGAGESMELGKFMGKRLRLVHKLDEATSQGSVRLDVMKMDSGNKVAKSYFPRIESDPNDVQILGMAFFNSDRLAIHWDVE